MTSPVVFLLLAVVVSVIGSVVVMVRHRGHAHPANEFDDFARRMEALAPDRGRSEPDPDVGRDR